jgi:hypothetical protein
VAAAQRGDILFYREVDLPPGVYTMETMVFDALAQSGSARLATLTVPAPQQSAAFRVSSLVVVNRIEEVDLGQGRTEPAAPLYVGRTLLYPNLGEPITLTATSELPFYFAVYGDVPALTASAQLLRNGEVLADAPVSLPSTTGPRVQHVGRFPIGALPAGTYELRIRVTDGRTEQLRPVYFTLQR